MHLQFFLESPDDTKSSVKDLVTILPQDPAGSTHIHAKIEDDEQDFRPASDVSDVELLKRDYEKLRLSHELSRIGLTTDLSKLLQNTLDVVFSMFPADNAVIMLVDEETSQARAPYGPASARATISEQQEILLSSTIVNSAIRRSRVRAVVRCVSRPPFFRARSRLSRRGFEPRCAFRWLRTTRSWA